MNTTLRNFNYLENKIAEYFHWFVILRPQQVTLGSIIIASKANVTTLADLEKEAFAELKSIIFDFECTMRREFEAEKFNYFALMMVDPNPHFHVIPRYSAEKKFNNKVFFDTKYPKAADLTLTADFDAATFDALKKKLVKSWIQHQ